jgi:ferredoxin-NADP reductase
MAMEYFETTITDKIHLTKHVISVRVQKPYGFLHKAGQFIQLAIPQGEHHTPRSYSLTSLPEEETLGLCIKIIPGGMGSEYICGAVPGDHIRISEALGRFTLIPETTSLICIGTGVGAAPLYPLLREASRAGIQTRMLFGLRHSTDIFWEKELAATSDTLTITLSQPEDTWTGARGRVTDHIARFVDTAAQYYICGNIDMVRDVKKLLEEAQVPRSHIHFEIFDT